MIDKGDIESGFTTGTDKSRVKFHFPDKTPRQKIDPEAITKSKPLLIDRLAPLERLRQMGARPLLGKDGLNYDTEGDKAKADASYEERQRFSNSYETGRGPTGESSLIDIPKSKDKI